MTSRADESRKAPNNMADDDSKRATYGDGTVRTRKDGLLEKRLRLGVDPRTGRYLRKSVYGKTLREIQTKARKLIAQHRAGTLHQAQPGTVKDYFEHETTGWLVLKEREISARTLHNYRREYEAYIEPHLGELKVTPEALNYDALTLWHAQLAREHGAYTANRVRNLLANALDDNTSLRGENPARKVRSAKHAKAPVEILTATELEVFLPATNRTRLRNMILLALTTGLRHGEATALHWSDVTLYKRPKPDEDQGELIVRRAVITTDDGLKIAPTPKSDAGRRTIGISQEGAAALRAQRELLDIEGQADARLVFPNGVGGVQSSEATARALRGVLQACNPRLMKWVHARRAELRERGYTPARAQALAWREAQDLPHFPDLLDVKLISFHDLRHTFASMMIAAGMDATWLSRVLGHNDPAFTMRTYAHFFERRTRLHMPALGQVAPAFQNIGGKIGGSKPQTEEGKEEARPGVAS